MPKPWSIYYSEISTFLFLVFKKRIYLCKPENTEVKTYKNETDISTINKKKKEQARIQRKNVNG